MSNANKKPSPLYIAPERGKCPVCGHTSYSSTGIHPQCAMQAADEVYVKRVLSKKPPVPKSGPRHFEKLCPRCKAILHVRRIACHCGFEFST